MRANQTDIHGHTNNSDVSRSPETTETTNPTRTMSLSRSQKAAVVLASLSADFAPQIAQELSDEELRAFVAAFSELSSIEPDMLNIVAREFTSEVAAQSSQLATGDMEAQRILNEIVDSERVNSLFDSGPIAETAEGLWPKIAELDDEPLLAYFNTQSATVCAVTLSQLPAVKAASLVSQCAPEQAREILLELARKPIFPKPAVDAVASAIKEEILDELNSRADYSKGGATVGEIVNFLPSNERDTMMNAIQSESPEIAKAVKKNVITFSELHVRLPIEAAPVIIREIDRRILVEALSYGNQMAKETVDYFFASISKRLGEQIREEVEEIGTIDEATGDAAHREFIAKVKSLVADGEIEIYECDAD